eukprot:7381774-Prymnesium_polylepis.1
MSRNGKELSCKKLADALKHKTEFAQEEWEEFGVDELTVNHFVHSGEKYFKPAIERHELHPWWGDLLMDLAYVGVCYLLGDVVKYADGSRTCLFRS